VILFLHNRYRTTGGEERVVDDLLWLVRERLGEPVELLTRSSEELSRGRAALGLLRGGLDPDDRGAAVAQQQPQPSNMAQGLTANSGQPVKIGSPVRGFFTPS